VVVVSEERGTIGLTRGGRLEVVDSAAELKQRLTAFLQEVSPERIEHWHERFFTRNLGAKLASFALAIAAWVIVFGYTAENVGRTYPVPIVYRDIPDGWLLEEPRPNEARVTLSGSEHAFRLLDPAGLTVSVDADELGPGRQPVRLSESNIARPNGLVVNRIEPQQVLVEVHRTATVELEVRAKLVGELPPGLSLARTQVSPQKVRLLVRSADRHRLSAIATEPVDLSALRETTTLRRPLVVPRNARLITGERQEASITVELQAN
jgi:YbbR domain-containing protein